MAPKGKKKKAAEQAAELERLAEEQRLAEIAEHERLEKERLEREEQERIRREEEARLQAELDARLIKEREDNREFYAERARRLTAERDTATDRTEWQRYVACLPLPDVSSEAAVNEMLTEWRDKPGGLIDDTMDDCELAHQTLAVLRADALNAQELELASQAEWQGRLSVEIGDVLLSKLDAATADFLQVAESHANAKNECIICHARPSLKYGLWVNLAKNPRVKQIDFAELSISSELPKSLALASVAIRALHYTVDRAASFGLRDPSADGVPPAAVPPAGGEGVMTLGGVLWLELLGLPPTTKKVKGWTLRQVGEHGTTVVRQPYPAPHAGGDATALSSSVPQLRVSYTVAAHVVVPESDQRVGWWDPEARAWREEGIADVAFDAESRALSFSTGRLTALALLQRTDLELPYKNWLLAPQGRKACRVTLETQRHLVEIDVDAGGATLRAPRLPELGPLLDAPMAPTRLLLMLREGGINLSPQAADADVAMATPKLGELEREMHEHLAPLLCSLQVAPSRWNKSRGEAKCLYRVAPKKDAFDLDEMTGGDGDDASKEAPDPFAAIDGGWQTILVKHKSSGGGTALVKALDSAATCDETVMDGTEAHSTPLLCLASTYPELIDELKQSPMLYQDTLRQLLNTLRLFSFTTRPAPPKEK